MPPASAPSPPRARLWIWGLGATVLLVATYWPALHGELVWNDTDYVTRPELRSLAGLKAIWLRPGVTEQYYPLLHSFFWLQCRLWGDHVLGFHLVTLALHAAGAVMFGRLLRRLAVPGAWLAALLFAFHPVHVQSVAWITEQKNTLSLLFYLGAALAYVEFDTTRSRRAYFLGLLLFCLSLLCKTVTATLPAALLVVVVWRRREWNFRSDVRPLLPWFALGLASGLFTTWVEQHYVGADGENFALPWSARFLVAGRAVCSYLGRLLWPGDLNFIYPRWTPDPGSFGQWLYPLAVLLGLALLALHARRQPHLLAAFLLFVGSLFPVLGFVNLYGALYSWTWDHWQYLPDLAPLALAGAGLAILGDKLAASASVRALLVAALILPLAWLSWRHTHLFLDEETLYRETLRRNPTTWMAHNNLANLLSERSDTFADEARGHYEEALRLRPEHAGAHVNLGNLLRKTPSGIFSAREHYEEALRLQPSFAEAHNYLGSLLAAMPGHRTDALAHFQEALRINPNYAAAHSSLADLYAAWPGHDALARTHYQRALQLAPRVAETHNNFANFLVTQPDGEAGARRHYERALELDSSLAEAHNNLANLLRKTPGHEAEAMHHYETALELRSDYPDAHNNLGQMLAARPETRDAAIGHFRRALLLAPAYVDAHLNLAGLLSQQPDGEKPAIELYEEALRLKPDLIQVHYILAVIYARQQRFSEAHAHAEQALAAEPTRADVRQLLDYLNRHTAAPEPVAP